MIDLLTLTNSPMLAAACDALPGMRLFVDLERNGKAERQAVAIPLSARTRSAMWDVLRRRCGTRA